MKRFRSFWRLVAVSLIGLVILLGAQPLLADGGQCPTPPIAVADLSALQNAVTAAQNALAQATAAANAAIQQMWSAQQALWDAQQALMNAQRTGIGVAAAQAAVRAAQIAYMTAQAAADQARAAVSAAQAVLSAAQTALANAIAASGLTAAQLACYGIIISEVAIVGTECYLIGKSYNEYCAAGGTNFAGEVCWNYIYYCNPLNWSNPFR